MVYLRELLDESLMRHIALMITGRTTNEWSSGGERGETEHSPRA